MPSITFKAIEYYYLFIQNHYILTLFISSLFARLNQPSRKIPEPEQRVVSVQLATPTLDLDERSPSYCAQGTTLRYTIFTND